MTVFFSLLFQRLNFTVIITRWWPNVPLYRTCYLVHLNFPPLNMGENILKNKKNVILPSIFALFFNHYEACIKGGVLKGIKILSLGWIHGFLVEFAANTKKNGVI